MILIIKKLNTIETYQLKYHSNAKFKMKFKYLSLNIMK